LTEHEPSSNSGITHLQVIVRYRLAQSEVKPDVKVGRALHLIGDVLNHRDPKTTAGCAYFQTQQRREELNTHGGKVLSFVAAQLREGLRPTALSTENVLQADDPPARYGHYFRREALHELVWTAPIVEVARRLGVSDVALAKLCGRAAISVPRRGYWVRVESGQPVGRSPLPPPPKGLPELLRIRGQEPIPTTVMSEAA